MFKETINNTKELLLVEVKKLRQKNLFHDIYFSWKFINKYLWKSCLLFQPDETGKCRYSFQNMSNFGEQ